MAVTPELEASPQPEAPPEPERAARIGRHWKLGPIWPWVRLLALLVVAGASEIVYVFLWPLSYLLTQAQDFTYEYLVQNPRIWERLVPMLARFDQTWPGSTRSLDFLVDALVRAFVVGFVLYLEPACRAGGAWRPCWRRRSPSRSPSSRCRACSPPTCSRT